MNLQRCTCTCSASHVGVLHNSYSSNGPGASILKYGSSPGMSAVTRLSSPQGQVERALGTQRTWVWLCNSVNLSLRCRLLACGKVGSSYQQVPRHLPHHILIENLDFYFLCNSPDHMFSPALSMRLICGRDAGLNLCWKSKAERVFCNKSMYWSWWSRKEALHIKVLS